MTPQPWATQRVRRQRRLAQTCVLVACSVAAALAMVAACRGQCPGGVCRPPGGWQSAPAPQQRWRVVPVGPNITAAVCRVQNEAGGGTAIGSGTLVHVGEERACVLTCRHLFDEGVGELTVRFPSGAAAPASIVAVDAGHDLALIETAPPGVRPVRVAEYENPRKLLAIGLGGEGQLRAVQGDVAGRSTPQGARYPSVVMHGAVRPGDSGGPVLDERGLVVGVVWGAREQTTYATVGEPLTRLLAKLTQESSKSPQSPAQDPHLAAKPPLPGGRCHCECPCAGDCVQRDELARYATLADLDRSIQERWHAPRSDDSAPPKRPEPLASGLGVLAAALGVGGPVGVALFAAQLLLRRRSSHRRGPGGPRASGFRPAADERPPTLRVEPAAQQTSSGRQSSTAPERGA